MTSSTTTAVSPGCTVNPRRSSILRVSGSRSVNRNGVPRARATSWPMISPPSAGDTTRPTGSLYDGAQFRRQTASQVLRGRGMVQHQRALQIVRDCAVRWSGGSGLRGRRRWRGTDRERIRLAASQRPTIPLKLNATDQGCSLVSEVIPMIGIRPYLAVLCALLLVAPAGGFAADPPQQQSATAEQRHLRQNHQSLSRRWRLPPNNLTNSTRIDSLLRAGNLYLSLQDAIALALENNLDIAIQRYGPQLADAALRQAEAGGFARGVSTSVTARARPALRLPAPAPRPAPTSARRPWPATRLPARSARA